MDVETSKNDNEAPKHNAEEPVICNIDNKRKRAYSTTSEMIGFDNLSFVGDKALNKQNRMVLRRESTEIEIRERPRAKSVCISQSLPPEIMMAEDLNANIQEEGQGMESSNLLSVIYGLHVIILSFVLTISHYFTADVKLFAVDVYFLGIYTIAIIWLLGFQPLATSCNRRSSDLGYSKFSHVTNRWLKGVIGIFGLAIIIKNSLEFLGYFQETVDDCKENIVRLISPIVQAIFTIAQVNFLFRFSKACVQDKRAINRFGAMHVLATNLSIWLFLITNESVHALDLVSGEHNSSDAHCYSGDTITSSYRNSATVETNDSVSQKHGSTYSNSHYANGDDSVCECATELCDAIDSAESFLYPFVIEFSLVASCMMYIVWKNVGTIPHACQRVIKPSYKFYSSYKGVVAGILVVIVTVVVLIVLGTQSSGLDAEFRTYCSELKSLIIHNLFLSSLGLTCIAACIAGFWLFKQDRRPIGVKEHINLDLILLLITIAGAIAINFFYILAVYLSMAHEHAFIWGAIYPVVDLLQCTIQVVFILHGLYREPTTSEDAQDLADQVSKTYMKSQLTGEHLGSSLMSDLNMRSRIHSDAPSYKSTYLPGSNSKVIENNNFLYPITEGRKKSSLGININLDEAFTSSESSDEENEDNNQAKPSPTTSGVSSEEDQIFDNRYNPIYKTSRVRLVSERSQAGPPVVVVAKMKVAPPNKTRLKIRDIAMFLLVSNACMWIFWSLDGTAFFLYSWPLQYYEGTTWTTINSICAPLSIFFRMHSAACLFEIWSYA